MTNWRTIAGTGFTVATLLAVGTHFWWERTGPGKAPQSQDEATMLAAAGERCIALGIYAPTVTTVYAANVSRIIITNVWSNQIGGTWYNDPNRTGTIFNVYSNLTNSVAHTDTNVVRFAPYSSNLVYGAIADGFGRCAREGYWWRKYNPLSTLLRFFNAFVNTNDPACTIEAATEGVTWNQITNKIIDNIFWTNFIGRCADPEASYQIGRTNTFYWAISNYNAIGKAASAMQSSISVPSIGGITHTQDIKSVWRYAGTGGGFTNLIDAWTSAKTRFTTAGLYAEGINDNNPLNIPGIESIYAVCYSNHQDYPTPHEDFEINLFAINQTFEYNGNMPTTNIDFNVALLIFGASNSLSPPGVSVYKPTTEAVGVPSDSSFNYSNYSRSAGIAQGRIVYVSGGAGYNQANFAFTTNRWQVFSGSELDPYVMDEAQGGWEYGVTYGWRKQCILGWTFGTGPAQGPAVLRYKWTFDDLTNSVTFW